MSSGIAVWWVKRDARLTDNACLTEAERLGLDVLPFFVFEPSLLAADDTSDMHIQAQWQAVSGLRTSLRKVKADIIIAHGEVVEKLTKLHAIVPFTLVLAHEEIGNDLTFRRDRAVAEWCRQHSVEYREFPQSSARRSGVNRDRLHELWQTRIVNTSPLVVPTISQTDYLRKLAASTTFPQLKAFTENHQWQAVSELDAHGTLANFLDHRGRWYRGGISSPNTALTAGSRLSVHLAWGTLTARQIWHAVRERLAALDPDDPKSARWKQSLQSFLSRLHWRDHFTQRLESEPALEFRSLHPCYRDLPYENDERLHAAWQKGDTGFPLIDAVMRCLAATGFVNFRMRAMVVSFACHVLHLDWRLIHPHLARVFRDYDPGIHLNQLQMQAGVVGLNTIRVYNPIKQLTDWDGDCRFVKQWIPELKDAPAKHIVNGDRLPGYPSPVAAFAERSKHMTSLLYGIRKSAAAQEATPAVLFKHGSRKKANRTQSGSVRRKRSSQPKQTPTLFDDLMME